MGNTNNFVSAGVAFGDQRRKNFTVTAKSSVQDGMVTTFLAFSRQLDGPCNTNVTKLYGNTTEHVILLHNSSFDSRFWLPLFFYVQKMKQEGKNVPNMYSYDIRGQSTAWIPVPEKYNDDNPFNHYWSYDDHVQDLMDVYNKYIKHEPVTLVGYGNGGNIAQSFGFRYPDLVKKMVILQTGVSKLDMTNEINYLSQWILSNPEVTFLTLDESFVDKELDLMFNTSQNDNVQKTSGFLLAQKMYRTLSATTNLQSDKLLSTFDFSSLWAMRKTKFPVTFLLSNDDRYTVLTQQAIQQIKSVVPNVKVYIVKGTHAFAILNTGYVFDAIVGKDLTADSFTERVL